MKTSPYILVAWLIVTGACTGAGQLCESRAEVEIATKASGLNEIESLVVLAFDSKGRLDAIGGGKEGAVRMSVSAGEDIEYRVIANAPENMFEKVSNWGEFKALRFKSGQNIMLGKGCGKFQEFSKLAVPLERLISKIRLDALTPAFYGKYCPDAKVFLERVFIINSPADAMLEEDSECSLWHNKLELESPAEPFLVRELHREISGDSEMELGLEFICIPNIIDNSVNSFSNPLWSPRNTRLVVEISMDGKACYYPVTMPSMRRNRIYRISNLLMQSPGAEHPDKPVLREDLKFSIEIIPWMSETKEYTLE